MRSSAFIIAMLFFGGLINAMDRAVIGVLAPSISTDLTLDPSQMGLVFSAFAAGYTLFALVGGWATDRWGAERVMWVAMTAWSLLCGMTGLAVGFASMLLLRFVFGAAESPWQPAAAKLVAQRIPSHRYATAYAVSVAGQPLGGAIAGPIAGMSAALFGWRIALVIVASIGFIWVALWLIAKTNDRNAKPQPDANQAHVEVEEQSAAGKTDITLGHALKNPALLSVGFAFGAATYLLVFFQTWLPSYFTSELGFTLEEMGFLTAAPWLMGTLGVVVGGLASDRIAAAAQDPFTGRRRILSTCLLTLGGLVTAAPFLTVPLTIACLTVAMGVLYFAAANYFAMAKDLCGTSSLGSITASMVVFANFMSIISPAATGYILYYFKEYTVAFLVNGAVAMLGACVVLIFARSGPTVEPAGRAPA